MTKITKEKFKTYGDVFDQQTLGYLHKLYSKGIVVELKSPIAVGKESNVFTAKDKNNKTVIVKIYRVNTCDFNKMYKYINADPRFLGMKKQKRKIIGAWAKREYSNLKLAKAAGVNVPKAITFIENILVMQYIGNKEVAKLLKINHPENPKEFAKELINDIKRMYKAGLVHGDLSEFNILNYKDKPVIIDLSHGMKLNYPNVEEYLERDIINTCNFFNKLGLNLDKDKIIKEIKNG